MQSCFVEQFEEQLLREESCLVQDFAVDTWEVVLLAFKHIKLLA